VDAFVEALQDSGAFYDLNPATKELNEDDNSYRADVVGYYLAPNQAPPARKPAKPAKSLGRGRP
jgi:hypothetical protein